MSLPDELLSSLPAEFTRDSIRAAVRVAGSKGSFGGETWFLAHDGGLALLGRGSIFDALEPVALAPEASPVTTTSDGFTTTQRAPGWVLMIVAVIVMVGIWLLASFG